MQLDTQILHDAMVVTIVEDRVDAAIAVQFKDAVKDAAETGPVRVILDMQHVQFLDSSGLGAVIGVRKLLGTDRVVELAGLTPAVAKVFRLTRMDTIFTIHSDALAALESGPAADAAHAC